MGGTENLGVAQKPEATIEFQEFSYAVVYELVENPDKEVPTILCFMLCWFMALIMMCVDEYLLTFWVLQQPCFNVLCISVHMCNMIHCFSRQTNCSLTKQIYSVIWRTNICKEENINRGQACLKTPCWPLIMLNTALLFDCCYVLCKLKYTYSTVYPQIKR